MLSPLLRFSVPTHANGTVVGWTLQGSGGEIEAIFTVWPFPASPSASATLTWPLKSLEPLFLMVTLKVHSLPLGQFFGPVFSTRISTPPSTQERPISAILRPTMVLCWAVAQLR